MITPGTPAGVSSIPRKSLTYFCSVSPGSALMLSTFSVDTRPAPEILRVPLSPVMVTVLRRLRTCSLPAEATIGRALGAAVVHRFLPEE